MQKLCLYSILAMLKILIYSFWQMQNFNSSSKFEFFYTPSIFLRRIVCLSQFRIIFHNFAFYSYWSQIQRSRSLDRYWNLLSWLWSILSFFSKMLLTSSSFEMGWYRSLIHCDAPANIFGKMCGFLHFGPNVCGPVWWLPNSRSTFDFGWFGDSQKFYVRKQHWKTHGSKSWWQKVRENFKISFDILCNIFHDFKF